jgi:nicotinamidase-related amidase
MEPNPKFTALVIVDMQNEFCKPGGKMYLREGVDKVIPGLKLLLERSRNAGVQVIFVQSVRYKDSPQFTRFGRPVMLLKGTWGSEFIEELVPRDGEPVVEKNTHDCFFKTRMDQLLEDLRILPATHTVIVTGVGASVCVYHAVIGFHVRDYNVIVPLDCCGDFSESHSVLETQMSRPGYNYNVTVTQSEKINFIRR